MSWFNQITQGPNQQQPANDFLSEATNSLGNPSGGSASLPANSGATASFNLKSSDFPSAPRVTTNPLSLENLTCAGQVKEPAPISYPTLQEQRCVLSWFQSWSSSQKERFLQDLLSKAVPGKVCTLLDSLSTLQVKDKLPNIFECQLRLWNQWFQSWREDERNNFVHMLDERNPEFVALFYKSVASTAGVD